MAALIEGESLGDFLTDAMRTLGFRKLMSPNQGDGLAFKTVFEHGIAKVNPGLTWQEAQEIVLDLASSGDDYGWPDKFQRGFFKVLREKYGKVAVTEAAKVHQTQNSRIECCHDLCTGIGIVVIPKEYGRGSAACICPQGRYLYSQWIKNSPQALDIQSHNELLGRILAERNPVTIPLAGSSVRELAEHFKARSGVQGAGLKTVQGNPEEVHNRVEDRNVGPAAVAGSVVRADAGIWAVLPRKRRLDTA